MEIRVSLNTQATEAAKIRAELFAELNALEQPDLHIRTEKREAEPGALALFEAYQFIVDHGSAIAEGAKISIPVLTAVLQLSNAILQRRGIKRKPKPKSKSTKKTRTSETIAAQPVIVVQVGKKSIELPADDSQLKRYISTVAKTEVGPRSTSKRPASTIRAKKAPKRKAARK
jgi:hypothetical protein